MAEPLNPHACPTYEELMAAWKAIVRQTSHGTQTAFTDEQILDRQLVMDAVKSEVQLNPEGVHPIHRAYPRKVVAAMRRVGLEEVKRMVLAEYGVWV